MACDEASGLLYLVHRNEAAAIFAVYDMTRRRVALLFNRMLDADAELRSESTEVDCQMVSASAERRSRLKNLLELDNLNSNH